MFLCVVFYVLGGFCLIGAVPALFSAVASCVSSSPALAGASWGWFVGAIVSALVCFAIGSLIDRQKRIEDMLNRMEKKLCPEQEEEEAISPKKQKVLPDFLKPIANDEE